MSSGDSDDGLHGLPPPPLPPPHAHNNSNSNRHASVSGAMSAGADFVDGFFGNVGKNRPRSSSSVAVGGRAPVGGGQYPAGLPGQPGTYHSRPEHQFGPASSSSKGVFKVPDAKMMPRPPASSSSSKKGSSHLLAQFPTLQKSVSTPSIVVDNPKQRGGKHG